MSPAAHWAAVRGALRKLQPDGRCYWCGEKMLHKKRYRVDGHPLAETIDHIKPRARGGGNHITNLCLAHLKCNNEKADGPAPDPAKIKDRKDRKMQILCEAIRRTAA